MPYSPTEAFPHPLANIRRSDLGKGITNKLSYALIDRLTWHGLGDLINRFRENTLGLEPLNLAWAAGMITRLKIPYTYCWYSCLHSTGEMFGSPRNRSPTLLPKPKDWGSNISVSGFYFLPTTSTFQPPANLMDFIKAGEPPIYIGFGSIVVGNPEAMTNMVLEAIQIAGVRALMSKGWGGLGSNNIKLPDNIFLLGNVPHSWLFDHVSAVVHHGGAGTTAAGLAAGKPTVVVPFFGDVRSCLYFRELS
jgi:UDP:flavonoid glycosyltransferase YjiC (YdhE family)